MKKNISIHIALLLAIMFLTGLAQAQVSTIASGGNASGSGGNVSYSIGQVVYTTNTGSSGSVMQGVQQAYEIFTVSISEKYPDISLTAFPNPTTDLLTLQTGNYNSEKLSWCLYDIQGKLLNNGQITTQQTQISMSGLLAAIYFVHILNQDSKNVQSFKIIKN